MSTDFSLFNFITDEDFRGSLEADYAEMQSCMEAQSWKAVHVLAGSLVETILIDHLLSQGLLQKKEALTLDLGGAISKCKTGQIISEKTADLCSVIRAYRNLIHPGRIIRLKERVSADTAQVAGSVVRIIVTEVSRKKLENYGYTAEQIVAKIEKDSSVEAIIPHLLNETKETEIERLLLTILPTTYLSSSKDPFVAGHLLKALASCFRTGFEQLDDPGKKKVTQRFVTILKEESDKAVMSYGTAFFRCSDLKYLSEQETTLVKDHLLSRCKNDPSLQVLKALPGIGGYLKETEIASFVDSLIRSATSGKNFARRARLVLEGEFANTSKEADKRIVKTGSMGG